MGNFIQSTVRFTGSLRGLVAIIRELEKDTTDFSDREERRIGKLLIQSWYGDEGLVLELKGVTVNTVPLDWLRTLTLTKEVDVDVKSLDITNLCTQIWQLRSGVWEIVECIQEDFGPNEEVEIIVKDGRQFQELPDWVEWTVETTTPRKELRPADGLGDRGDDGDPVIDEPE